MSGQTPADEPGTATTKTAPLPKPPRTWRPMALWSAGILLVLGLCWLAGGAYDLYGTHQVVQCSMPRFSHLPTGSSFRPSPIAGLGGPERATRRLSKYLALPAGLTGRKRRQTAAALLGYCGTPALPPLLRTLQDPDPAVRIGAVEGLDAMRHEPPFDRRHGAEGPEQGMIAEVLGLTARNDPDADVREAADKVLRRSLRIIVTPKAILFD